MSQLPDLKGRPVADSDRGAFLDAYGHLFEHSPWVAEAAWSAGPFADAAELHAAFRAVLAAAGEARQLDLVRAHPELADKVAMASGLTADSTREQASAGLDRLDPLEYATFHDLNRAYRERFGFPFVICVRLHGKNSILQEMARRVVRTPAEELSEALVQIGHISALRLADVQIGRAA